MIIINNNNKTYRPFTLSATAQEWKPSFAAAPAGISPQQSSSAPPLYVQQPPPMMGLPPMMFTGGSGGMSPGNFPAQYPMMVTIYYCT